MVDGIGSSAQYAITVCPTPVFNIPNIDSCFGGCDGDTLLLDDQGLMRTVETILFPHSRVQLLEQVTHSSIWKIRADEYPYGGDQYIDRRFVLRANDIPNRVFSPPPIPKIIHNLKCLKGTRYIWGGNWPKGIDSIYKFYPSKAPLNELKPLVQDTWQLKGVDCSGLLYYVTEGFTPRNTSRLLNFGKPIAIQGLTVSEIMNSVQNLDLIVWQGHTVCVLSSKETIESRPKEGVVKAHLFDRLSEIMKERNPVNDWNSTEEPRFVIRRWHPDNI